MVIAALGILGLIFGSFVNAVVWRLRQQELANKKSKAQSRKLKKQYSILSGRSMCPNCHYTLAAKDLIPVFSWLALRGRCRYCHQPISWQYPLVELVTAGLFMLSYATWPLGVHGVGLFQLVVWFGFITVFLVLAVYDIRWFMLPDRIVWPLVLAATAQVVVVAAKERQWSGLGEPVLGLVVIFGLFWLLYQLSKGAWIGGGDVKLALALGLIAGTPLRAFLIIFFASLIGTAASVPLLLKGREGLGRHLPFGPYLLAATFIVQLYGVHIVTWYRGLLLT